MIDCKREAAVQRIREGATGAGEINVVERPAARGYDFAGHHEIMMPLFRLALLSELEALQ